MKTIIKSIFLIGLAIGLISSLCFAETNKESITPVVISENTLECKEIDITDMELENYFNSIQDIQKRELIKKYFYLPSNDKDFNGLPENLNSVLSRAEYISALPNNKLKHLVEETEKNIPNVLIRQTELHETNTKKLANAIEISRGMPGTYTYTIKGSLPSRSGDAAWIKSTVTWTVNNYNQVTYLAPNTTTGLISYYRWVGPVSGDQTIIGGKGYVNKERSFVVSSQDQSDPGWVVWCSGVFGVSSVPESSNGGYYAYN